MRAYALIASMVGGTGLVAAMAASVRARLDDGVLTAEPMPALSTTLVALSIEAARCPPEPLLARADAHPLDAMPLAEIGKRARAGALPGSASIGGPTRGALLGGVRLESSAPIEAKGNPWGTEATIRSIERAVREVQRCFPATHKLFVGDISGKRGGQLAPHRSHQSGLDADVGFYYLTGPAWYLQATAENLDRPRTWALIRAFIEGGNVEYVFVSPAIRDLLRDHAASIGDPVDVLFATEEHPSNVIREVGGHTAHFHVRFSDPVAIETARRVLPFLPEYRALLERRSVRQRR